MLTAFLGARARCLEASGRESELLTTVPSTGPGRPSWQGIHPLVAVVADACARSAASGAPAWRCAQLLERGPGELGHLLASGEAFVTRVAPCPMFLHDAAGMPAIRKVPVIVVDDLYTSGAHAQSAARALALAGHEVAAVVPLGRLVAATDPRARGATSTQGGVSEDGEDGALPRTGPVTYGPSGRAASAVAAR
jgi:hypothetical protein